MKRFVILMLLYLSLAVSGCAQNEEPEIEKSILEQMQEYKTENVGDDSAVGAMLNCLDTVDEYFEQNMFAIQTEKEPYGLTIYYEPLAEYEGMELDRNQSMDIYAEYLFECIGNLGYVEYAYRTTRSDNILVKEDYTIIATIMR